MRSVILPVALVLATLGACAQLDQFAQANRGREQALEAFLAAQDTARQQLTLFRDEPRPACSSEHLAQASAGANANLALLAPAGSIDPNLVPAVEIAYGDRPIYDIAKLTLDVATAAADAGCPDQARVLYGYVIDRYVRSTYTDYRQRAEVGLAYLGES